jgi:DNA helicase HerA-like ATPase
MTSSNNTRLGTVRDVSGARLSVSLDDETIVGLIFVDGKGYRVGQVGSYVRIPIGYVNLFGIVSQVGAGAVPPAAESAQPYGYRWLTVQLIGEGSEGHSFQRGISTYPTINDPVHLVTELDLGAIYGREIKPPYVRIGSVASAESIPAMVDLNKLVSRHSAVVGTTGAGKSTTVVSLLSALSDRAIYPSSRIIIFDLHGEYSKALRDRSNVYRISGGDEAIDHPLEIPYWALNFEELLDLSFGKLPDAERGAVLEEITRLKREALVKYPKSGLSADSISVDSPIPFSIHQLWFGFHRLVNATHFVSGKDAQSSETIAYENNEAGEPIQRGNALQVIPPRCMNPTQAAGATKIYQSQAGLNMRRNVELLASRLRDPRYKFLFRPGPWLPSLDGQTEKDLDELLVSWLGSGQPISILDLSGVPHEIATTVVGSLIRLIFDALFWSRNLPEGGRMRPLLLVLEEAHRYLGHEANNYASYAVARVVKEGRKYGLGAMIVSQRPSEIDATILSQCGSIFAMRLSNASDRSHVTSTVTDNLEGLLNTLPILRTGEAIVVGEAVRIPVRTLIDVPSKERMPDSADPIVVDQTNTVGWTAPNNPQNYKKAVEAWRKQDPTI